MKGKVILIPVPYTDLTAAKLRPALVIFEGKHEVNEKLKRIFEI